ncbi:MAG: hypothetical protein AB1846_18115 [Chloroflexota bacterium]
MIKPFALFLICLVFLAGGSGCAPSNADTPTPGPAERPTPKQGDGSALPTPGTQVTQSVSSTLLTNLIGSLLASPENYSGQQVEIIGYYRGWDLLKEVQGTPPVTRSDWVIADTSGAIYVTGTVPEKLDPSSQQDTKTVIRLVATVESNQNGVYLKAQSVEVISAD